MSISIEKSFSEWKPAPSKSWNSWMFFAAIGVVGAFGCGIAVGYAMRDTGGEIEKLRLDAEAAHKDANDARQNVSDVRVQLSNALKLLGMGVSRRDAEAVIEQCLDEYKVSFVDSTEATGGFRSSTAHIGDHAITLKGDDVDIASVQIVIVGERNTSLATALIAAGFRIADPAWIAETGDGFFTSMLAKTTTDNGCFAVRDSKRVSTRLVKDKSTKVLVVTFSPNLFG